MDCRSARNLLVYNRAGVSELDADERQLLDAHLAGCPECDAQTRAERHVDAHLSKAMREVPIPAHLRKRLFTQLAHNREEWYRRWLARGLRVGAVAAVLLVGVVLALTWKQQTLPKPSTDDVRAEGLQPSYGPPSSEDAERWFSRQGQRVHAPDRFNYQYLESYSLGEFLGKTTPRLTFLRDSTSAAVYILSSEVFNLKDIEEDTKPGEDGYRFKVQIWKENGFVYVIRYAGDLNEVLRMPTKSE
jgi:hypothetical protein